MSAPHDRVCAEARESLRVITRASRAYTRCRCSRPLTASDTHCAQGTEVMRATAPVAARSTSPTFSLPDALLDPAAYPDRPASIELRETHISWVFLAGDTAYKVKKPILLPFLDYSTLALRHGVLPRRAATQPALCPGPLPRGRRAGPARRERAGRGPRARPGSGRVRGRDGPLRRIHDPGRPPGARRRRGRRSRRHRRRRRRLPRRRTRRVDGRRRTARRDHRRDAGHARHARAPLRGGWRS